MRVKILSGMYGGRFIAAPDTRKTHPMSERVRSSLFNIIGNECNGARVLDAFSGSGALGFEALSRGASEVICIERDRVASKIINENAQDLGVTHKVKVISAGVASWDSTASDEKFDIIFADPPYSDLQLSTVSRLFAHLKINGLMVLSHPGRESVPSANGVVVVDNRSYGDAALAFYRLDSTAK